MKKNLLLKISAAGLAMTLVAGLSIVPGKTDFVTKEVYAASKTVKVKKGNHFAVKGRYVYYTRNMDGTRTGIVRYDTKTKKKKTIVSYKYKGNATNGFSNMLIKGNYIYVVWDQYLGTNCAEPYIYRFDLKGKNRKKLACGYDFAIKGKVIYFIHCKMTYVGGQYQPEEKGLYRMSLTGKSKKKAKGITLNTSDYWLNSSNESIAINKTNFSLIEGSDSYYYRTYTSLRKTTASKERTIYPCKGQDVINSAEIHGKWVMLNISNRATNKMKLILMDTNGKNRKTLKQWLAGE